MFRPVFTLITLLGLLAGCAGPAPVRETESAARATLPAAKEDKAPPTAAERRIPDDSLYPLLLAEFALRRGDYDRALEEYLEQARALRDPHVSARATHVAQYLQREDEALEAARLWVELAPEETEANNTLAILLLRKGKTLEALPLLKRVAQQGGNVNFAVLLRGFAQLDTEQQATLREEIDTLVETFPEDEQLLLTRALITAESGDRELALKQVEKLLELQPRMVRALTLEASLLLDLERDRPLRHIEQVLEQDPDNKALHMQYARLLTKTDLEAARREFERLSVDSPRDGDILFSLALVNQEMGDSLMAKTYLKQLLQLGQRIDEAHYYLGRIEESEDNTRDALSHYIRVEGGEHLPASRQRIAALLQDPSNAGRLRMYMEDLRETLPEQQEQLFALEAGMLSRRGDLKGGMEVLTAALEQIPDSVSLRYSRSVIAEKQDNLALMESDLRAIIQQDPDNAASLNALGYTLANRTQRHEEAYDLISRALALEPEDPAILDSMGWVLYRLGKLEEAAGYLSKAYDKFPDPEIAAHYGEVLWAQGKQEEALSVWRGALTRDANHQILQDTLKRLGAQDRLLESQ